MRLQQLAELAELIAAAEVVDPTTQSADEVGFGATVTLLDADDRRHVYRIVGITETRPANRWVSWLSPIAKALMGPRPETMSFCQSGAAKKRCASRKSNTTALQ